jgi:hypothetical protein
MAEAILSVMAECRSCGWLGMGSERKTRHGAAEALYCPQCSGATKSWVLDQAKEALALEREKSARISSTQKTLDACRQARLGGPRTKRVKFQMGPPRGPSLVDKEDFLRIDFRRSFSPSFQRLRREFVLSGAP